MKIKSVYSFEELPKTGALVNESGVLFRAAKEMEVKVHDLHTRTANYVTERYGVRIHRDDEGRVTEDLKLNAAKGRVKIGQDTFGLSEELAEEHILFKWKTEEMQARVNLNRVEILNQLYSELMVMGVSAKDIESTNFRVDLENKKVVTVNMENNPIAQLLGSLFGDRE